MNHGTAVAGNAPRQQNLNERLNDVSERLQQQCQRIEDVLCRVNGTPTTQSQARNLSDPIKPMPSLPMATVVEHLESVQSRLTELARGVEQIA